MNVALKAPDQHFAGSGLSSPSRELRRQLLYRGQVRTHSACTYSNEQLGTAATSSHNKLVMITTVVIWQDRDLK